jgi:glutamate synthase domain-containing protein 3
MTTTRIDAQGMHYTALNQRIRKAVREGVDEIIIDNVMGQRFIADGLKGDVTLVINGVPGGDLAMFMSGPTCIVYGNCDHAPGNTMDAGCIIVHGSTGDAVAHSMRGGKIFVRDNIGYRGGIHMKEYQEKFPILVVGGFARAFLGEFMAGGKIIILGIGGGPAVSERGIGSGIHGGEIILRGDIDERYLGVGAKKQSCTVQDIARITPLLREFATHFGIDPQPLIDASYTRISPASSRPFANKYTWE